MTIIDFTKKKKEINKKAEKEWTGFKGEVERFNARLELSCIELASLKLALEAYLESNRSAKDNMLKDYIQNLKNVLYKIDHECEIYEG